jgi:hypothetical protein
LTLSNTARMAAVCDSSTGGAIYAGDGRNRGG